MKKALPLDELINLDTRKSLSEKSVEDIFNYFKVLPESDFDYYIRNVKPILTIKELHKMAQVREKLILIWPKKKN